MPTTFSKIKLEDYCEREIEFLYGSDGNPIDWRIVFKDELIRPNYCLCQNLDGVKFFLMDSKDFSEKKKPSFKTKYLKSLTSFMEFSPKKRIYLREVRTTTATGDEIRRFFTDEVLEILPNVLRQQNSPVDELISGIIEKYKKKWDSGNRELFSTVKLDEFERVLEELDIDKSLITIVPDPVFYLDKEKIIECGMGHTGGFYPSYDCFVHGVSQIIFEIFQISVVGNNWNADCKIHGTCNRQLKRKIITVMQEVMSMPEGTFISDSYIKESLQSTHCPERRIDQLYTSLTIFPVDSEICNKSVDSNNGYVSIARRFNLPIYPNILKNSEKFLAGDQIPTWMAQLFFMTGWATQFFGEEHLELKKMLLEGIHLKVPMEHRAVAQSFVNSILGQDKEVNTSEVERHQKMLISAEERKKKLRQKKRNKRKNKKQVGTPSRSSMNPEDEQTSSDCSPTLQIQESSVTPFGERVSSVRTINGSPGTEPHAILQDILDQARENDREGNDENIVIERMTSEQVREMLSRSLISKTKTSSEDRVEEIPLVEQKISSSPIEGSKSEEISSDPPKEVRVAEVAENPDASDDFRPTPEESFDPKPSTPIQSKCCSKCLRTSEMCNEAKKDLKMAQNKLEKFEKKAKRTDEVERKMKEMEMEMKRLKGFEEKARRTDDLEKQLELEKKTSKELEKKAKKVDNVEKRMREKESELGQMKSEFEKSKLENEKMKAAVGKIKMFEERANDAEKQIKEKDNEIKIMKTEMNKLKASEKRMKTKDRENGRSKNRMRAEISEFENAQEAAVMKISSLEEQIRQFHNREESLQNEMRLIQNNKESENSKKSKILEELQMTNKTQSLQIAEQQQTIQNLCNRLASESTSPSASNPVGSAENVDFKSEISMIRDALNRLESSQSIEKPDHIRFTLLRHQKISDNFHEKKQLKLAKTMTDRLSSMSNRSEIRELATYEYQQYKANFQNYYQTVVVNIQKMKETGDCSLITPLPSPPSFSERFMTEYWNQMNQNEQKDSECCICLNEMKPDQKTLECDQCKKITHLECASRWLKVTRNCPHCRTEQLDPNEFPTLN